VVGADGRITAAGARAEIAIPVDAERIDVSGRWITPGLIDAHVHLSLSGGLYGWPGELDLRALRSHDDERARWQEMLPDTLARYIAAGVTGVIDRGGPMTSLSLRAFGEGDRPAPRIALAGPMLSTWAAAGFLGEDAPNRRPETAADAADHVRALAAAGFDMVKIHFMPADRAAAERSRPWLQAAIQEADRHGLPVVVHATDEAWARLVVEAGADQLVHSIDDRPLSPEFAALLAERGVVTTTTLVVHESYREVFTGALDYSDIELALGDPEVIASLDDLARIPARLLPKWILALRDGANHRRGPPAPATAAAAMPYYFTRDTAAIMAENLRRLTAAGAMVAAGTDAGTIGTLHGPAIHRELALMAAAGIAPLAIIRAATLGGAWAMARAGRLGTLEAGKWADFLILGEDPVADIGALQRPLSVVKGGVAFDPAALLADLRARNSAH